MNPDTSHQSLEYTGHGDERLDKRLPTQLPYSRSFFEHVIKRGGVYINQNQTTKILKKSYKLQQGDIIYIESLERFVDGGILEEAAYLECIPEKNKKINCHFEGSVAKSKNLMKQNPNEKISDKETGPIVSITNEESRDVQSSGDPSTTPYGRALDDDGGKHPYIPVIHETQDYMVIYKPKRVLSHPNSIWDLNTPSVVASIYNYCKDSLPSSGNFIRAGLVHRLDKDTDGYMIIVKTEKGLEYFKNLFQQKSLLKSIEEKEAVELTKGYTAICDVMTRSQAFLQNVEEKLNRGTSYYHIANVIPNTPHPVIKEGITKIKEIEKIAEDKVMVTVEILTGRTHQIRYHLSSVGLPIVGDYLYHPSYMGKTSDTYLQLTANKLSFIDIYGEKMIFGDNTVT